MRGLRLPKEQVAVILDTLDAQSHPQRPERHSRRVPFRADKLVMRRTIEDEPISVMGRNISRHGLAFLFGQYLTPLERVRIHVPGRDNGDGIEKEATVVRCRHIGKLIHEVGVRFDVPLQTDPADETGPCLVSGTPCSCAPGETVHSG